MSRLTFTFVTALAAVTFGACEAERPGDVKPDAGLAEALEPPSIDSSTPMMTPYDTAAIRGQTNGSRVVVKGTNGDPVVRAVLPGGGFCVDAPIDASGPTLLNVFALKDGLLSPATTITVTKDPSAPIPSSPMCAGMEEPVCVAEDTASANCGNGKDDNCNGYTDMCDTTCNGCMEDALGPNWAPFFVPQVPPGTYMMSICPCRDDWFAFQVKASEVIHVKATFTTTVIDLDMKLQRAADAEQNLTTSVASSVTTTGTEEITYTPTVAGLYYLKIYAYKKDDFGPYTLTIY
jgi:hypothetical protein